MAYIKYKVKNNSKWQIAIWISADTNVTELILNTGEGWLFGANQIIKLVEYTTPWDESSWEVGFENMLITDISWDTLTITREFGWTTARSFPTWSYAYGVIHSNITEDIQDEVVRLEVDKLDNNELRTWLTNNRLLSSNNSWAEAWITYWTNWQVLTSNGWTAQPTFKAIPEQTVFSKTTITTLNGEADHVMVSDWSSSNANRKILSKFLNPYVIVSASNTLRFSADTTRTGPTAYSVSQAQEMKRFRLWLMKGTVRLKFEMTHTQVWEILKYYIRIFQSNGSETSIASWDIGWGSWTTISRDFSINPFEEVVIKMSWTANVQAWQIRNARIYYNETIELNAPKVLLD